MVDPVSSSTSGMTSLLRAQTAGISTGIAALKSNRQAQQAIIDQLQRGLEQNKVADAQKTQKVISQNSAPLPRGSLVDVYV